MMARVTLPTGLKVTVIVPSPVWPPLARQLARTPFMTSRAAVAFFGSKARGDARAGADGEADAGAGAGVGAGVTATAAAVGLGAGAGETAAVGAGAGGVGSGATGVSGAAL